MRKPFRSPRALVCGAAIVLCCAGGALGQDSKAHAGQPASEAKAAAQRRQQTTATIDPALTPLGVMELPPQPEGRPEADDLRGPGADLCGNAPLVTCGQTFTADNTNATTSTSDPVLPCRAGGANQGAGSVWFRFVATATSARVSTCGSVGANLDSIIAIYNAPNGTCTGLQMIACNDDDAGCAGNGFLSTATANYLVPGQTYYIEVAAWNAAARGVYQVTLTCPAAPNDCVTCSPNAVAEGEPTCGNAYVDNFNSGCNNLANPQFTNVSCGQTICGTAGNFNTATGGFARDTDWYRITLPAETMLNFSVTAEFPVLAGIINTGGIDACPSPVAFHSFDTAPACTEPATVEACLPAGTWYLFVSVSSFYAGAPCGAQYQAFIGCNSPCPPPPCTLTCPGGGSLENEPDCGLPSDFTNGGCNGFGTTPIVCGQTVCGTSAFNGQTRDTDWFEFTLPQQTRVTFSVLAEFNPVVGIISADGTMGPNCDTVTGFLDAVVGERCIPAEVTVCMPAGTWYAFVGPDFNTGVVACGADYQASLSCGPCETQVDVSCAPGSINESEPSCGVAGGQNSDFTNGGCNSVPPIFIPVTCGATVCGTGRSDFSGRDTDWYEISLAAPTQVTFNVTAEFPVQVGITNSDCANLVFAANTFAGPGQTATVTACLQPGNWYLFVAADLAALVACGSEYVGSVTCGACVPPPGNDDCTNPAPLGMNTTVSGSTLFATDGTEGDGVCAGAPGNGSRDVWYTLAGNNSEVTISTCDPGTNFDTVIQVFTGACNALTCVGFNDDSAGCGTQSSFTFCAVAGTNYRIRVSGFALEAGNFILSATGGPSCGGPPADCNQNAVPDAQEIAGNPTLDCFTRTAPLMNGFFQVGGPNGIIDACECQANFNRDAAVGTSDISAFLSSWFNDIQTGQLKADINCSGSIGTNDVSTFLSIWFNALNGQPAFRNCP